MAKILIVDDSAFARNALKVIIEGSGHEVVGRAANGAEAITLFTSLRPELVTLDWLMAGEKGDEVLEKLMRIDPGARVIMISGMADPGVRDQALQAGAKYFLAKPFEDRTVVQTIAQAMQA
jgi:two-component system chemotaxis response regulator CheY